MGSTTTEDTEVGDVVGSVGEESPGQVSKTLYVESRVPTPLEETQVMEVHKVRGKFIEGPGPLPQETQDVVPLGVRLGKLYVRLLIPTLLS